MALTYCADEIRFSAVQARGIIEYQQELRYPLSVKVFSTGGGQLPFDTANTLRHMFGCEIINTYVSTECGLAALARGDVLKDREKKGNCFFPLANIQIVNDDNTIAAGEGAIRIKSFAMAWGYEGDLIEKDSIKGTVGFIQATSVSSTMMDYWL
jgi:acyl-coenzyme A synthetase/AMP-(fatty) acid ligase